MGGGGGAYTGGITDGDKLEDLAKKRLSKLEGDAKTYNIFVPHSWDYDDEYQRLIGLLDGVDDFGYKDYSVPKDDPIDANTKKQLEEALREQILHSTVVLVPAGMYVNHREWIQREIDIAKEMHKPIIAVKPRGNERMPEFVTQNADEVVGWNKDSIVAAIRRVCQGKGDQQQ
jgi:GTPase Era involved in 16S rRNA processing